MTKLTVENLHLSYGAFEVLKGITVELRQGEILVLLGSSGSGKTTLLRSIAGFEKPSSGVIRVDDKEIFNPDKSIDVPVEKRNLGLVFQSYALWPHKTVFENVSFGLKLRRISEADVNRRVTDALEQLGLASFAGRFPYQLSGGQQQRVALARALVYDPPVILLDEPLSNLDAKLRDEAKAWLRTLIRERGLSAILVTHDQSEALAMADRIAFLAGGRMEQVGTPVSIYESPETFGTAEFFGSNNVFEGVIDGVSGEEVKVSGNGWSLVGRRRAHASEGATAKALARIESFSLLEGPQSSAAGPNRLAGELTTSMFNGDHWQHVVRIGDQLVRLRGTTAREAGPCWLTIPESAVWVF